MLLGQSACRESAGNGEREQLGGHRRLHGGRSLAPAQSACSQGAPLAGRLQGRECATMPRCFWTPQLPKLDDQLGLGFLDLMQLRVVARVVDGKRTSACRSSAGHWFSHRIWFSITHPLTTDPVPNRRAQSIRRDWSRDRLPLSSTTSWAGSTGSIGSSSRASKTSISTSRSPDGGRSASSGWWWWTRSDRLGAL